MNQNFKSANEIDPSLAQSMFDLGGILIIIGMPMGTEFGIDMQSWQVGDKFKGIKMIPPGLHFFYFSAVNKDGQIAPRTGFFHIFKQKEIIIFNYDLLAEDLIEESDEEQKERIKSSLRELDRDLGPYPLELWSKWISFTQHINSQDLTRIQPLSGRICSAPELVTKRETKRKHLPTEVCENLKNDDSKLRKCNFTENISSIKEVNSEVRSSSTCVVGQKNMDQYQENSVLLTESEEPCISATKKTDETKEKIPKLPDMEPKPGTEIRFSKFPEKPHKKGATPDEITRGNIDSSYTVQFIIDHLPKPENILGELQFAFVCFLVGQAWEGWEHWRQLVTMICKAENCLKSYSQLYLQFISILHYQVEEVPEELFADIVENSNFLVVSLRTLFANINDNAMNLPHELVLKAHKFKRHLTSKFRWNLILEEEGDEAPVVVELDECS